MEKSEYKALKEQLFSRRRNGFDRLDGAERGALEAYCADYKAFLDAGKTERLCAAEVFCLALGIFIGAVWANVSWGRYWGWDPKETWALITLFIYTAALHASSLPAFRRPMFFHWFALIAFLSVLITYFGVNFILGGIHSYA